MADASQSGLQYNNGPGQGQQYTFGAPQQGQYGSLALNQAPSNTLNLNQAYSSGGLTGQQVQGAQTQAPNSGLQLNQQQRANTFFPPQGTQGGNKTPITNLDAVTNINGVNKTFRSAMAEGLIDQYGNQIGLQNARPDQIPDYQSIIQPTLDALNGGVDSAQSSFNAAQAGIRANVQQSKNDVNAQSDAALNSAQTQQQGLTSQEQNQEALQRQASSDSVRGIQAQFGGSNSAGSYLGEQAYRSGIQNVQQLQTGLQNATAQINNQIANVHNVTQKALQDIDSQASAQTAAAQNQLSQQLQQLRMATGMIQSQKAQMAAQHIENYQQYVRSIDAQNSQIKANLAIEQQRAQDLLALYGQRVSEAMNNLKSVTLGTTLNGQKQMGSFDQKTGQYLDMNGNPIPNPGTGMTAAAGGGTTGVEATLPKFAANNYMNQPNPQLPLSNQQAPTQQPDINSVDPAIQQRLQGLGFGGQANT